MRELHAAVDVAAGPDARHGGLQILVDGDEAAVRLHPRRFESEVFRVGPAAAGDEDLVDAQLHRFADLVLDTDDFLAAVGPHRLSRPAAADHDAFLGQDLPNAGDDVGVLFVDDLVEHFHHDDLAAETPEELRELDADVAAAEDQKRGGKGILVQERYVVEESVLHEPFDRWDGGPGAGGDDDVVRGQPPAIDVDLAARRQRGLAEDHLDAECAELFRIIVMLDGVALRAHRIHHRLRRHARRPGFQAVGIGMLHLVNETRRGHQRFGRHAAGPEAVAAQLLPLDQRNLASEARAAGSGNQPGRPSADDDDVE